VCEPESRRSKWKFRDIPGVALERKKQSQAGVKQMATRSPGGASKSRRNNPSARSTKGNLMAIQYLLVIFPDQRAVLADEEGVGFTNHTLMLPADEYVITLAGEGYQPAQQDVVLSGTSIVKPKVIFFTPTPPG
jgi:PEGA domain